jgi:hypothetical protein
MDINIRQDCLLVIKRNVCNVNHIFIKMPEAIPAPGVDKRYLCYFGSEPVVFSFCSICV